MLTTSGEDTDVSAHSSLAAAFSRLGWLGFWTQVVLGAVPAVLMIYAFTFGRGADAATRSGLPLVEYLTVASLLIMAFTTLWSYTYTRHAKCIARTGEYPTRATLQRSAWTGVIASALGLVLSMVVMLAEVAHLLFYFLRAPKAGVPVIQTTAAGAATWVSAIDIVSLMALMLITFGEVAVLVFSLWLLFRTMLPSAEAAHERG